MYASTLRENLKRTRKALDVYKEYSTLYPKGKYSEYTLYWIVQLSRLSHDIKSVVHFKDMYLRLYPRGRWIEEIKLITVSENR